MAIRFKDYSFGATSAVITSLAIIISLSNVVNAKISIITALLVIAIADNISDSFGIHIYQESQLVHAKEVKRTTLYNFLARLLVVSILILFIAVLPIDFAVILSIVFGLSIIVVISYFISKHQRVDHYSAIVEHLALTALVIVGSLFLRTFISQLMLQFF
jgi:hypothetical protein